MKKVDFAPIMWSPVKIEYLLAYLKNLVFPCLSFMRKQRWSDKCPGVSIGNKVIDGESSKLSPSFV